jgi:hypothetical protein
VYRNLGILRNAQPGSQEAVQAMSAVIELQNVIADINAANDLYLQQKTR